MGRWREQKWGGGKGKEGQKWATKKGEGGSINEGGANGKVKGGGSKSGGGLIVGFIGRTSCCRSIATRICKKIHRWGRVDDDQVTTVRVVSQHEMKYLRLVRKCLRTYGLLCLGVYRLLDAVVDDTEVESLRTLTQKRYVITHPPADFRLIDTDKVAYWCSTCLLIFFAAVMLQHGTTPFAVCTSLNRARLRRILWFLLQVLK